MFRKLKYRWKRIKQRLKKRRWIFGLIIFHSILSIIIYSYLLFEGKNEESFPIKLVINRGLGRKLILLYEEELFHVENDPFRPTFYNNKLSFKLNLTSTVKYLFKNNSNNTIHRLKIICSKSSKNDKQFHSFCQMNLNFRVNISNTQRTSLVLISNQSNCLLSLEKTLDIISVNINERLSRNDIFRFNYQWSNMEEEKLLLWSSWPPIKKCLNLFLNKNENSKLFRCPRDSLLIHSSSRELYIKEQNSISQWLDFQFKYSIYSNKTNNTRRLVPFEMAKKPEVCSAKFQKWILNYQKWHENVTSIFNNGSMTLEEQRNLIINLNIYFLIYEKHTSGIADRIIHFISTYFVALLTNRLFIFDQNWPDFLHITQSSLNYEQQFTIPWFSQINLLNKNLSKNHSKYLTLNTKWFSFDRFTQDFDYNKQFPERILIFKGHTGGVIHTIHSNTSIYRKFLTENLEMNENNIFGCLYHSLFYRLSQLIKRVPLGAVHK